MIMGECHYLYYVSMTLFICTMWDFSLERRTLILCLGGLLSVKIREKHYSDDGMNWNYGSEILQGCVPLLLCCIIILGAPLRCDLDFG